MEAVLDGDTIMPSVDDDTSDLSSCRLVEYIIEDDSLMIITREELEDSSVVRGLSDVVLVSVSTAERVSLAELVTDGDAKNSEMLSFGLVAIVLEA